MTKAFADRALVILLRLIGTSSLTAVLFVVAPREWMATIHADLGLGPLPATPIVFYLARSTSAFYAIAGGLFWLVSFDLERYRTLLTYLGVVGSLLGVALFGIDLLEGLPPYWTYWEGPFVLGVGLATLLLSRSGSGLRRAPRPGPSSRAGTTREV